MDYALKRAFARRGAVFLLPRVKFESETKSKYCVLLESYTDIAETLIAVFTTSRMKFAYQKSSVLVANGDFEEIDGDTLIQCENWREIHSDDILLNPKTQYIGTLSPEIMERVDEAISFIRNADEIIIVRMLE